MKNSNGENLVLDIRENNASIRNTIKATMKLDDSITSWNLKALEKIIVIDSIGADAARREAAFERRRSNNIFTWAIIGGLADASNGEDSALDGALLGGLFGAATTSGSGDPEARVLLIFTNGDKLGLVVNQDELLKIMEVNQDDVIGGMSTNPLTDEQKRMVLNERKSAHLYKFYIYAAVLMGALFIQIMMAPGENAGSFWIGYSRLVQLATFVGSLTSVAIGLEVFKEYKIEDFIKTGEKL